MHEKFLVHVEGHDVVNGSANFSGSSATRNSEDRLLFANNPAVAGAFVEEFERLWERGAEPPPLPRVHLDHPVAAVLTVPVKGASGWKDYLRLRMPDWINVVAVTDAGELVLVRQPRFGTSETTLEIPVESIGSGDARLLVQVTSPDGVLDLASGSVNVRSTAISGLGLIVSLVSLSVLLTWWGRTIWRVRRTRRTASVVGGLPTDIASEPSSEAPTNEDPSS